MKRILSIFALVIVVVTTMYGAQSQAFPTKVLVVLAEYSDIKLDVTNGVSAYNEFFNGDHYTYGGATGSVQKYFFDQSYGKYVPQFDVVGPVTLAHPRSYYGTNDVDGDDEGVEEMVAEACELAHEQGVNFAPYDVNGDGYVDAVVVVYAGPGETETWAEFVYPQTSYLYDDVILDNKIVSLYACVPELKPNKKRAGIGEMVYQFSHILGLPTLSDTEGGAEKTLGDWDVMDHGCYNNDGNTPAAYSAYERFYLGWVEPILLNEPMNVRLRDLNESGDCAIITRSGQTNLLGDNPDPREFYILENRQQLESGWDEFIPGHGMLLTKIDYVRSRWEGDEVNVMIKGKPSLLVDIIEADGKAPKYKADNPNNGYLGKPGDAFPTGATSKSLFSDKWYFENVAEKNGAIQFIFNGGVNKGCTVKFDAGEHGTAAKAEETESAPFAGVTLPSVTPKGDYTFLGWTSRKNSTDPDAGIPGQKFYPMSDCSVYAVMKDNTRFWVHYDYKGVVIGDYFDFNGAYIKKNAIHDIAISFGKQDGYAIPSETSCYVKVECAGKKLKNVAGFEGDSLYIRIPASAITDEIFITIINTRYQDAATGCADYEHIFTSSCGIGGNELSGYNWEISMANIEADMDYDSSKGAKFGSGASGKAPLNLSFYTTETAGCGISKVEVEASMASGGDAMLDVYVAGNFIGNSEELEQESKTYTYELDKPYSGSLQISFTNTKKAIYVKRIAVFFEYLDPAEMEDIIPDPGIDEDEGGDDDTAVESIATQEHSSWQKMLRDGYLYISNGEQIYTIQGLKIQ